MDLFCTDPRAGGYLERIVAPFCGADRIYLENVARFAAQIHAPEVDEEEGPYILHPLRVALLLVEEAGVRDPEMLAAALLHDTQEHARGVTTSELRAIAGERAAALAEALAFDHRRSPGVPVEVSRQKYLERLRAGGEDLLLIKMADRLDNFREAVRLRRQKAIDKRLKQERRDYAPIFSRAKGPAAQALRTRLDWFVLNLGTPELPSG